MSENKTKLDLWWNSPKVKRTVGIFYSVGASVVIIGAMGKILHTSWGGAMLGIGMGVEAFLFFIGVMDKPHEEFDWHNHFKNGNGDKGGMSSGSGLNFESISEKEMQALKTGITNLSNTATQLNSLSQVANSTESLSKKLDAAGASTDKFVNAQNVLSNSATQLSASYTGIMGGMEQVEKNTKTYATRIDDINKSLQSINSIYEIQLQNIKNQSEGLTKQTDAIRMISSEIESVNTEILKMKTNTTNAAEQSAHFNAGTTKLAAQIQKLNEVYGNMLNALG